MDIHSDPLLGPLEKTPQGVRAGDCILVEKLGQGGMGVVYLGKHLTLNLDVAVKVLPFHAAAVYPIAISRFQTEARSTVRVDHPNIVRVFHVGEEHGVHYLVMEFIDGESAADRLRREGPLPEADALGIAVAVGEALAAAHAKGILHRDVKPANIMIRSEDGRVKLADLGLAKALGGEGGGTTGITATGQMLGTPAYMSPEQAEDASRADGRTDIYSLGATLYALLSGRAPFEATHLLKLLLKVTREEPKELRKLRRDVSEETAEAVKKLMRKGPADRPRTMEEVVALLRDCLDAAPTRGARGLARPELAGRRKVTIAIEAGMPAPAKPRTLEDVPPSEVGRAREAERRRRRMPTRRAEAPVVARLTGGKKLAIVLGILAAIGAAGGAAAYLYGLAGYSSRGHRGPREASPSQMEAGGVASRRAEIVSLQRREEDARKTEEERRRKEADAKAASQLKTAQSFLEAGLLDKACDEAAEALKVVPDHADAKRLLAEIQSQTAARQNEAERAADLKKWMDEGLRLRLAGKIEEAARAYERAQASAASGDTKAAEAAARCLAEHKSQVIDAEARSAYEKAAALNAQALTKKDDAATRGAVSEAEKRPDVRRAEEAGKAEAARWRSQAEDAERRADIKAALGNYREAQKHGADVATKIASLTEDLSCREAMARARDLIRRKAWEEAAGVLQGLLRSRPGDREASSLLEQVKEHLGPPPTLSIDLGGGVRMEMVYIKPGRFMMGSDGGSNDEKPVHEVVITRAFYLGKFEVTQEQYERVMGANPSYFKGVKNPVERVPWNEAREFCRKLSQRTGRTFCLPTEAEWEYACRAGSTGKYCFGDEEEKLGEYGWYSRNAGGRTHPVGQERPNSWGLYDMHGNVWEWCADWHDKAYYGKNPRNDPTGPAAGSARVLRGGSWSRNAYCCRSAYRSWPAPTSRDSRLGFRAAASLVPRP